MHDLVLKQSKTSPKPEIKEGVWILLLKIPSNYIITPNTYPPLFLLPWIDSTLQKFLAGVFIAISATTFFLFLFVISFWFFKESSTPQFSSETLTGLDLKLWENQFLFPTWAELCEVSLSKPLHSSALLIKAGAGIHHRFYAAELTIKISENKCYVYRNQALSEVGLPLRFKVLPVHSTHQILCNEMHLCVQALTIYSIFRKPFQNFPSIHA